jgi:hypothetical protein
VSTPQSSQNTINRTLELTPSLTPPHKLTSITLRSEVKRKSSRITLRPEAKGEEPPNTLSSVEYRSTRKKGARTGGEELH